jgi:hypothetical protein
MSITKFNDLVRDARKASSPSGTKIDHAEVTAALAELSTRGVSEKELEAAKDVLASSSSALTAEAREVLVNFVNRRALTGPAEARQSALDARISDLTKPNHKVTAGEINAVIDLLAHNGATKDERWLAYGWLTSLSLTPGAKKSLREFIYQGETPLPKVDAELLREHLVTVMNNFHHSDTLPMNQRPWGNGWEARPHLNLTGSDGHKTKRMELGADMAERGFSYAIVVSNSDKQPTLPSTNSHDYVWFERKNKATGEVQYLADSPMSSFVSQPFRYDLEQGLKALDKKEFTSYDMGKERFDAVMAKAFPGLKPVDGERRSIVKVKERSDGNLDVTVERRTDGADLRKIDPKLRMLADRAGIKFDTKDTVERVTLVLSAFGIPVE